MVIAPPETLVIDGVLADARAYRAACLAQPFASVTLGDQTFHGIAPPPDDQVLRWLHAHVAWMDPQMTFLRLSPLGQVEPNDEHDDRMMGSWTGILYLNPDPPHGDGTVVDWQHIAAAFNRLLIFPAHLRHCRALLQNYGTTPDTARLIQVIFGGDPSWP